RLVHDESMSQKGNLRKLADSQDALVLIGRGGLKHNWESVLTLKGNKKDSTPIYLAPGQIQSRETLIESAMKSRSQGACDFVAEQFAAHLPAEYRPSATTLRPVGRDGTNHAFVITRDGGEHVVVDGAWRQFAGKMGIRNEDTDSIPVLVG